jgi:predicted ATPase
MVSGEVAIQGTPRRDPVRMRLGFASEDLGYAITLGPPVPMKTAFDLDPEIKREVIWAGPFYRPASALVERNESLVKARDGRGWNIISGEIGSFDGILSQIADPKATPEVFAVREQIRGWRFYDHFRTDKDAPARQPQVGTRTNVLNHDGRDLAAAIQTIREVGNFRALDSAIADAFPGCRLNVAVRDGGLFSIEFFQEGLLRPLSADELSDGTLRYLLLIAALLTPRPPSLMVLNEPETSLHPELLPALARLIIKASENSQVWIVTHAKPLISALSKNKNCNSIQLEKELGRSQIAKQGLLERPAWHWPD